MAPLLPKLRGQFAEFLNQRFPERLRLLASPTCVSFSTVAVVWAFLGCVSGGFTIKRDSALRHGDDQHPDLDSHNVLHTRRRNINLLSIVYAFRPRLRDRLTLGGFTFPRKP
jgi:hypothetical protein